MMINELYLDKTNKALHYSANLPKYCWIGAWNSGYKQVNTHLNRLQVTDIPKTLLTVFFLSIFSFCSKDEPPSDGRVNIASEMIMKSILSKEFGTPDTTDFKSQIETVEIDEKKSIEISIVTVPTKVALNKDTIIIKTSDPSKVWTSTPNYANRFMLYIFHGKYKFRQTGKIMFPYLDKYKYEYYPLTINNANPKTGDTLRVNCTIKQIGVANTGYDEITYYKFEINSVVD